MSKPVIPRFLLVRLPAGLYGVYDRKDHKFPDKMAELRSFQAMAIAKTPMAQRGELDVSDPVGNWWRAVADIEGHRGEDAALEMMQEHMMRSLAARIGVLDMSLVDVIPEALEHEVHVATCLDPDMTVRTANARVEVGLMVDPIRKRTWELRGAMAPPRTAGEKSRLFVSPVKWVEGMDTFDEALAEDMIAQADAEVAAPTEPPRFQIVKA